MSTKCPIPAIKTKYQRKMLITEKLEIEILAVIMNI